MIEELWVRIFGDTVDTRAQAELATFAVLVLAGFAWLGLCIRVLIWIVTF